MPGDLSALIVDSDFQGMDPATKRDVLARATGDASFNQLGDSETQQFVSGAMRKIRLTRPDLVAPPGAARPPLYAPAGTPQSQANFQQSALGRIDSSDPTQLQFGGM